MIKNPKVKNAMKKDSKKQKIDKKKETIFSEGNVQVKIISQFLSNAQCLELKKLINLAIKLVIGNPNNASKLDESAVQFDNQNENNDEKEDEKKDDDEKVQNDELDLEKRPATPTNRDSINEGTPNLSPQL